MQACPSSEGTGRDGSRPSAEGLRVRGLAAAVFWTWLWGPVGLLLSTPLTVCLVVLGRHVPQSGS